MANRGGTKRGSYKRRLVLKNVPAACERSEPTFGSVALVVT
jgi:hypothetical protein